ncbi:hypothetical protein THAOC_03528 [Thalassiosira oceanica]|uniref:MYND-type domain-containing protein n=1 Tax=Thalassiosira oceanica TaxID=159749 RepID=K0TPR9_THAOC|nr:hypothetical protein THAOC_03528 [Thalassiosira oceanica]|eukprot:EJK74777.1 hypothetical protein THAOC_03528 [Thalassiosira oceanica]
MPSRKKARGRRNRARKEAIRTAELRSQWEPMALCSRSNHVAVPCEHALTVPPKIPQEGTAVSFMNHIAGEGFFNRATSFPNEQMMSTCFSLSRRFPGVREKDNEQRALAIDLLLRFLRNVFVRDAAMEGELWFHQRPQNEAVLCIVIYLLELHGTFSALAVVERRSTVMGAKLMCGNRRDVAKFVAKRLPCTCLKELHRAARKKLAKSGKRLCCQKRFPKSELFVCTGCNYSVYCLKDCQRADWSNHKKFCNNLELMSRDLPKGLHL